jgi:hypothetical protein
MEALKHMRLRYIRFVLLAVSILATVSIAGANEVTNGSFSNGSGWVTAGDVEFNGDAAVLTDQDSTSGLFQKVLLSAGTYRLSFDFKNDLSNSPFIDEEEKSFFDSFFATLYFSNVDSNNPGSWGQYLALFDMDSRGPFNSNGTIVESDIEGYSNFSILFSLPFGGTAYAYAIPMFEIFDENLTTTNVAANFPDSSVSIDNVSINTVEASPVPEPGTLVSLGLGMLGLLVAGRKKYFS